MALIHSSQCGMGVPTGTDPESPATAQAVQSEMIATQAGAVAAQAAANSIYTRSPFDFADMGLNIFSDVALANAAGAGGPAGAAAAIGYSAPGVPFGPSGSVPISSAEDAPAVEMVPLTASVSGYPGQPKLTTNQGVNVPPVGPGWRQAWARRPRNPRRLGGQVQGKTLGTDVSVLQGAPYPVAGAYPVSCSKLGASSPADNSAAGGISIWWWLGLVAVGLLVVNADSGSRR